ncbi:tRNA preQ1(34) S-adenosylmethionine ribosyltransferase-isomerase QueA [Methylovorus sp. MP688]|jgi:S-adenosylmethionine:tRNA ribosyltransferase-isomerase|uniref:tRNA preQ1(34) S-adenosylmethionine ribosyltransferase-isomerase QueA n=1 Tax=Methylovorus sp. (strain MP688) TaxID=887061 RepID=UPI0001EC4FCA|nr:tRNA preQ1(34) S-adenosylmethionine ribosyltransferase-isomerase QueA [Methylovorus sp. MP688]ADQ85377.1 S-adenosylmethionine/tRNA-ribosyltransferase-isomerase [Methylovorus sp. MP688]
MRTEDFDFFLPEELIAQFPAAERDGSRLLRLDGNSGAIADHQFRELPQFLNAGDVLIFNDTRVIKARLQGHKESGGSIELLIERPLDTHRALAHIRASRSPKPGSRIFIGDGIPARVIERQDDLFLIEVEHTTPLLDLLDQYGALPLPPYITHAADAEDDERYQTVYARTPGAVAAPTAGLHFNQAMLDRLQTAGIQIAYVTLHVGAGTFQPVRVDDISEHRMHSEIYTVPPATVDLINTARAAGHKITAVGTTALRALESAARSGALVAGSGETDIFITPGYRFQVVERLLTNFHLPKSTLMMLVSAFAGVENIRAAYAHAIASRYRFFSYGDAMLLERRESIEQAPTPG